MTERKNKKGSKDKFDVGNGLATPEHKEIVKGMSKEEKGLVGLAYRAGIKVGEDSIASMPSKDLEKILEAAKEREASEAKDKEFKRLQEMCLTREEALGQLDAAIKKSKDIMKHPHSNVSMAPIRVTYLAEGKNKGEKTSVAYSPENISVVTKDGIEYLQVTEITLTSAASGYGRVTYEYRSSTDKTIIPIMSVLDVSCLKELLYATFSTDRNIEPNFALNSSNEFVARGDIYKVKSLAIKD